MQIDWTNLMTISLKVSSNESAFKSFDENVRWFRLLSPKVDKSFTPENNAPLRAKKKKNQQIIAFNLSILIDFAILQHVTKTRLNRTLMLIQFSWIYAPKFMSLSNL